MRKLLALPFLKDATAFDILAGLPEDWIPRPDGPEVGGFLRVAAYLSVRETCSASRRTRIPRDLMILLGSYDLLRASRGRWAEFADRMLPTGNEPYRHLDEAVDMALAFAREVVVPELFRAGLCDDRYDATRLSPATAIAARVLFEGKGFKAILDEVAAWHLVIGRVNGGRFQSGPPWSVPFQRAIAPNKVELRCLGDDAGLIEEGYAMSHCVGGFGDDCRAGRAVIVSVRDASGTRLSTAELHPLGPSFTLVQHHGPRNGPPPAAAKDAVRWLLHGGLGSAIPISQAFLNARERGGPVIRGVPDHDPAAAIARWIPHLQRLLREPAALRVALVEAALKVVRDRFPAGAGVTPDGSLSQRSLRWPRAPRQCERSFGMESWMRLRLSARPERQRERLARVASAGTLPACMLASVLSMLPLVPFLGWEILLSALLVAMVLLGLPLLSRATAVTALARRDWERRASARLGASVRRRPSPSPGTPPRRCRPARAATR